MSGVVPTVVADGFDGGRSVFLRSCDGCTPSAPCPKHEALIAKAYVYAAAQNAAVVAGAQEITAAASANLVTA